MEEKKESCHLSTKLSQQILLKNVKCFSKELFSLSFFVNVEANIFFCTLITHFWWSLVWILVLCKVFLNKCVITIVAPNEQSEMDSTTQSKSKTIIRRSMCVISLIVFSLSSLFYLLTCIVTLHPFTEIPVRNV